ncbi:MAG: hypothetical protein ABJ239_09800 [Erythrobacter sp.]
MALQLQPLLVLLKLLKSQKKLLKLHVKLLVKLLMPLTTLQKLHVKLLAKLLKQLKKLPVLLHAVPLLNKPRNA